MNPRYIYMAIVLSLSYVLFFQWGQDQKAKEVGVEEAKAELEVDGLGDISILENDLLKISVNNQNGYIVESRLKEFPVFPGSKRGVRVLGFEEDISSGSIAIKYYLKSGFSGLNNNKLFPLTVVYSSSNKIILESKEFGVRKTIALSETPYEISVFDENLSGAGYKPYIALYRNDALPVDMPTGFIANASYRGVAFNTKEDPYKNTRLRALDESQVYRQSGGWVAFIQKYFMAAILTPSERAQTLTALPPSGGSDTYVMGAISRETKVDQIVSGIQHKVFLGPKIRSDLISRASDLELTIDMGWFWFLAQPLMMLLSMINAAVGNWGVSIILLTVLIKLLLWPVSAKGFSSMAKMRTAGPKLKEIQERYKDDRAKLGTEMMALYKKEGINPAGGCFPLLLQMPVFIAFFFCLRESVELRHESFFFWIQDLSAPDPLFILPVMFAGLMYLTMQLNPQPPGMDPTQAQVMKFMPIIIAAVFVIMPSGLVLYSVANSGISLVQQRAMYKKYGAPSSNSEPG